MARRSAKSTGRRLSGSTSEVSHSSLPWYTSGTPGEVSWTSLRPSPLLQPAALVAATSSSTIAAHRRIGEDGVDQPTQPGLEVRVAVGPRRRRAGLAGRLLDVGVQPLPARRPRADDRLPREQLERSVAERDEAAQAADRGDPLIGDLAQGGQARPRVLAALGVVRRQRGHRRRPRRLAHLVAAVELGDVDGELVRVGADLGQRAEPGEAVEGTVLDALGHHHPGRLLEAGGARRARIAEQPHDGVDRAVSSGRRRTASSTASVRCSRPTGR